MKSTPSQHQKDQGKNDREDKKCDKCRKAMRRGEKYNKIFKKYENISAILGLHRIKAKSTKKPMLQIKLSVKKEKIMSALKKKVNFIVIK